MLLGYVLENSENYTGSKKLIFTFSSLHTPSSRPCCRSNHPASFNPTIYLVPLYFSSVLAKLLKKSLVVLFLFHRLLYAYIIRLLSVSFFSFFTRARLLSQTFFSFYFVFFNFGGSMQLFLILPTTSHVNSFHS